MGEARGGGAAAGLPDLPASRLVELIRRRDVSPLEVMQAHIARIEEVQPRLNVFAALGLERALDEARAAERAVGRGGGAGRRGAGAAAPGPLHGLPVSVKDAIEVEGLPAVAGTRLREGHVPARDAPVVRRLRRAGAIVIGKTNVPECALDWRTENPVTGRTGNPWDPERTPGGSSGGEAAAIAAGCSAGGIGSDLGGSIRVPAHFCGVTGLKPTPGRVPATGHFPPATGVLAQGMVIGPLARRVADLALLYGVLRGFDPADPGSMPAAGGAREAAPAGGPRRGPRRAAFYTDDGVAPVTAATRAAVEGAARVLQDRGFEVVEMRPPGIERAHDLWQSWLARGGVAPVIALYEGREQLMGPLIRSLQAQMQSRPMSLDQFLKAWLDRDRLRESVVRWMKDYPILLSPVASLPAFRHEHRGPFAVEGWTVEYAKAFSYAQAFNLLGLPAAAIPWGRSPEGLPIGVQVAGRPFREGSVLETAALLESSVTASPPGAAPGPKG